MEVLTAGYRHTHSAEYRVDCPTGEPAYLLVIFRSGAYYLEHGEKRCVAPGSVAIFAPGQPFCYGAADSTYIEDWVRFSMDTADAALFEALGIPLNRMTQINSSAALSELVHKVAYEMNADNVYRQDVVALWMQMLFFRIGQLLEQKEELPATAPVTHYHRLVQLRNELAQNPQQHIDVEELAKRVYMSKSHFQHTYKRLFGVSVLEDCSRFRMKDATLYLSSTDMTVKEVSSHCGYSSELHFIRSFKKRFDMTPTEYRQSV